MSARKPARASEQAPPEAHGRWSERPRPVRIIVVPARPTIHRRAAALVSKVAGKQVRFPFLRGAIERLARRAAEKDPARMLVRHCRMIVRALRDRSGRWFTARSSCQPDESCGKQQGAHNDRRTDGSQEQNVVLAHEYAVILEAACQSAAPTPYKPSAPRSCYSTPVFCEFTSQDRAAICRAARRVRPRPVMSGALVAVVRDGVRNCCGISLGTVPGRGEGKSATPS
jgi:hypothetical protein